MVASAEVSVIVPCYNEAENITPIVTALRRILSCYAWEVIFVDDHSPDGTIHIIRSLACHDYRVRGLCRMGRKGLSSAVIEGIMSSSA
ncbi:MAG: glycosyltransferase, partial [Acetobacter sp.]|nr:glycosyltransferase [Acetobacter sp.]